MKTLSPTNMMLLLMGAKHTGTFSEGFKFPVITVAPSGLPWLFNKV